MNKKSLIAIERIISCINELSILTQNKTAEYFYDSFEMNILIDLVNEIECNINKISSKIKSKYKDVDWNIIKKEKHYDAVLGESLNIGKIWQLSSKTLKDELLVNLSKLLKEDKPTMYKMECNKHYIFKNHTMLENK